MASVVKTASRILEPRHLKKAQIERESLDVISCEHEHSFPRISFERAQFCLQYPNSHQHYQYLSWPVIGNYLSMRMAAALESEHSVNVTSTVMYHR